MTDSAAGRAYAWWLGQRNLTFWADAEAAAALAELQPGVIAAARENRRFVERAVKVAAAPPSEGGMGITQFVDVGAGPPVKPSVATVASGAAGPGRRDTIRAVYADSNPAITMQTRALGGHSPDAAAITGDLRDPAGIFGNPELRDLIDTARPVCLLLASVLHYVTPDEAREAMLGVHQQGLERPGFTDLLAPGSAVVISVGIPVSDQAAAEFSRVLAPARIHTHSRVHVAAYFDGFSVLEPGLVWAADWRPDHPAGDTPRAPVLAGVGRKL